MAKSGNAESISLAVYLDRHSARSSIYSILVVCTLVLLGLLPFLFVDVSINSAGMLRPVAMPMPVKSAAAGIAVDVRGRENLPIRKGQRLIQLQSPELLERKQFVQKRLVELERYINDLEVLRQVTKSGWRGSAKVETPFYMQTLRDYRDRYQDAEAQLVKARRDHARSSTLYKQQVIADSEMETADEALRRAEDSQSRLLHTQQTECEQGLVKYGLELAEMKKTFAEIGRSEQLLDIIAPVSGTIQQWSGVYVGSYVFSGQELGLISPDTSLIAEIYVAPTDIGMIRQGMRVRLSVTAYNHNEWGMLDAEVFRIAEDVAVANDRTYYLVACRLSQDYLMLSTGHRGRMKKGMSVQAHFMVARRSLWNLLFDKVDDWLNPNLR